MSPTIAPSAKPSTIPVTQSPTDVLTTEVPATEVLTAVNEAVERYFDTLNRHDFAATASLFAEQGILHPPFEDGVTGPGAIARYLEAEAKGIALHPQHAVVQPLEDGNFQVTVSGRVQMPIFSVNVAWYFTVTPQAEILAVGIKLLASLEELLHIKR